MKIKFILAFICFISYNICNIAANEYKDLCEQENDLRVRIKDLEAGKVSGLRDVFFPRKNLEKAKQELSKVIEKKNRLIRSTDILIDRIELSDLPDMDPIDNSPRPDIEITLDGSEIYSEEDSNASISIPFYNVRFKSNSVLRICDDDLIFDDSMGKIFLNELWEKAMLRDSETGSISGDVSFYHDKKYKKYKYKITYRKRVRQ